jgi:hypothetical protein
MAGTQWLPDTNGDPRSEFEVSARQRLTEVDKGTPFRSIRENDIGDLRRRCVFPVMVRNLKQSPRFTQHGSQGGSFPVRPVPDTDPRPA